MRLSAGAMAPAIANITSVNGGQAQGLAIGLAGSLGASRWMSSLVFGISAHDPLVLGAAALSAMLIVAVAAAVPLWRAIRISPIETLHEA